MVDIPFKIRNINLKAETKTVKITFCQQPNGLVLVEMAVAVVIAVQEFDKIYTNTLWIYILRTTVFISAFTQPYHRNNIRSLTDFVFFLKHRLKPPQHRTLRAS